MIPMDKIHSLKKIPNFTNEAEEAEFWSTHELGDELLDSMEYEDDQIDPDAKYLYDLALERFSKKNYEGAINQFTQALFIKPNYDAAYICRGIAKSNIGDKQGAIEDYTKAIDINPRNADAYLSRAADYIDLDQIDQGINDCTEAIHINPNDSDAYYNRGNAYLRIKDYTEALNDYSRAIDTNPNFAEAYNNRGFTFCCLSNYERSIQDYKKAISINPRFDKAYVGLGVAQYFAGLLDKSNVSLSSATQLFLHKGKRVEYLRFLELQNWLKTDKPSELEFKEKYREECFLAS
jgi:tetratricopeptide (TPR) repeat protein